MTHTIPCGTPDWSDGSLSVALPQSDGLQHCGSSDFAISGDVTLHNSILVNLELCFPHFLAEEDIWIKLGKIELSTEISLALIEMDAIGLVLVHVDEWQQVYTISDHGKRHLASLIAHGMASDSGEDLGDVSDHLIHKVPKPDSSPFSMAARLDRGSV